MHALHTASYAQTRACSAGLLAASFAGIPSGGPGSASRQPLFSTLNSSHGSCRICTSLLGDHLQCSGPDEATARNPSCKKDLPKLILICRQGRCPCRRATQVHDTQYWKAARYQPCASFVRSSCVLHVRVPEVGSNGFCSSAGSQEGNSITHMLLRQTHGSALQARGDVCAQLRAVVEPLRIYVFTGTQANAARSARCRPCTGGIAADSGTARCYVRHSFWRHHAYL